MYWNAELEESEEEPITVYGPYPCKAITKILWRKSANNNEYVCFGMIFPSLQNNFHVPYVSFSEKNL